MPVFDDSTAMATSTGKGHAWRPPTYFPDTEFRSVLKDPLPPGLDKAIPEMLNPYITTTGDTHDRPFPKEILIHERYQKAPGNWNVDFIKDCKEKLDNRGWRLELSPGNQETEIQANYKGLKFPPGVDYDYIKSEKGPQSFTQNDHFNDGPTKIGHGSSINDCQQGKPFYVRDQGILRELDPYISTTSKDHRRWNESELKDYPKKDNATYYVCEEYPKAWGHGPHKNPLPKNTVPRERPPMRDSLQFKYPTRIPFLPKVPKPVPNTGLKTESMESYVAPSDEKWRDAVYCPVDVPYTFHTPAEEDLHIPKHYETSNQNYGSNEICQVIS